MISTLNKAKKIALSNGQNYHIAAILYRDGNPIKIGTNQDKTHPIAHRFYSDGSEAANMHAEMDVLRYAQRGDTITVVRFLKDGTPTMSKPCRFCMALIKKIGIKSVRYTNWKGTWEETT